MKQKSENTVEIPIKGKVVPDKKLGNIVVFNYDKHQVLLPVNLPSIYQEFSKPLPKEAEQEGQFNYGIVKGYKYQYIVNRLNEVVGIDHWHMEYSTKEESVGRTWETRCYIKVMLGNWQKFDDKMTEEVSGRVITVPMRKVEFVPIVLKEHVGKCTNMSKGWSIMGSIDNAFKKCAALYGIGKEAYEGSMVDLDMISEEVNPVLQHKISHSVKVEKTDPLPISQGDSNQQKTFNEILTKLNSVNNLESFIKVKNLVSSSNGLTPDQDIEIKTILSVLQATYEK